MAASKMGNLEVVELLLRKRANVNQAMPVTRLPPPPRYLSFSPSQVTPVTSVRARAHECTHARTRKRKG
jgi:hypothetical protein